MAGGYQVRRARLYYRLEGQAGTHVTVQSTVISSVGSGTNINYKMLGASC